MPFVTWMIQVGPGTGSIQGVADSRNTAQFLGHLPGQRGVRGPFGISEGTLLLVDESSMIPIPDLSDLVALAEARSGMVVLAGDSGQLQAVENGGAMSLLAGALGYVRLADPVARRMGTGGQPAAPRRRHLGAS